MVDISQEEYDAAAERGRIEFETQPRAVAAGYDRDSRSVVLDLANGCTFIVPVALMQGLQGLSDADLDEVMVDGEGFGLYWPRFNIDFYVPALVSGVFGTREWMRITSPKT